ncbi:MAG: type IV pilus assembly protein PilM [Planctomycetota bacterium]|nr:type IV pilus assembly protein PilM [Planctomycetota bacterium]
MAHPKAAWGIEIGSNAIKAIRLERDDQNVRVTDFCVIPHKKVLTTPDLDEDEMIRLSLGQLISQKDLEGEHLVMSVPGHSAFARFAKLPPVEPKKVPDIVKFEAVQQIPFPIEEVEWDYQTFTSEESPEIEVGIFAITRDRVQQRLSLYSELGLTPEAMTLSPVSVYNAMAYDLNLQEYEGPVVFLDIGTRATDVIVAEEGRCWIRTFPLGGTHFTEAIASAFKLSYSKAEKLKREAASSKYAKQIMQSMRPVFSDLLQDLQRSIGYYQSLHRESELKTLVGLGSTFKIPGLRKFIGQQLQIDTIRLDEFKKIAVTGREATSFAENTVNMASAYGCALQGVGMGDIVANLVPVKALREQVWHAKTKWFAAAAAVMVLGAGMTFFRPIADRGALEAAVPTVVNDVLSRGKNLKNEYETLKTKSNIGFTTQNMTGLLEYRDVWPFLVNDSALALASSEPQDELLQQDPELILGIDATERRLIQLSKLDGVYSAPTTDTPGRRFAITLNVELSHENPIEFLNATVAKWLRDNAEREGIPYKIVASSVTCNPTMLQTITITEEGEQEQLNQSTRPPDRNTGPSVTPSDTTGGQIGRTTRGDGPLRSAPGANLGGPSAIGSGRTSTGRPPDAPPVDTGTNTNPGGSRGGNRGNRGGSTDEAPNPFLGNEELNKLAPLPTRPRLYEPGDKKYRAVITFEVEVIDPKAIQKDPDEQADAARRNGEEVIS